jgi:hypothetical protein
MVRHAIARHCRNRNQFVHDSRRDGFARKRRGCALAGPSKRGCEGAGKYYNYMKKQQKKTARI